MAAVVALLRWDDVQVLTLTGPGKTRLARQTAADVLDEFPDGVVFVPLAALTDQALVPLAVAAAIGVREEGGQPAAEAVPDVLAGKALLLVLDNCEHLLDAAPLSATFSRPARGSRFCPPRERRSACGPSANTGCRRSACRGASQPAGGTTLPVRGGAGVH